MKYLAIDTASKTLKILVCRDGVYEYFQCDDFKAASVSLMPEVDRLLKKCGLSAGDMDFYACVNGPGSFTGIRIGMATIKAFAYVYKKPVVTVTTLDLLAYNAIGAETIVAVCDASNGMRYIAVYDGKMRELLSPKCLDESELSDFLSEIEEPYSLVCEGVTLEKAIYPENCEKAMIAAVEAGASVARSGNEIEPLYIRKPQAERDLEKKNAEKSE